MTQACELSFCELRSKEVVNSVDGRRLGRIIDLVFSSTGGEIHGIIVPYSRRVTIFKSQDIFIPWECVKKIGEDVIIVELNDFCGKPAKKHEPIRCTPPVKDKCAADCADERKAPPPPPPGPDCDRKCEKCMLFDCQYRWNDFSGKPKSGPGVYMD